ncbi:hypothetical protein V2J09_021421 [Rumex salicifolius]
MKEAAERERALNHPEALLRMLKKFLILVPMIFMTISKIERLTSYSYPERRSAAKYHQSANKYYVYQKPIGVSIPMKATFLITYVMVDGWTGVAAEVNRLVTLVLFRHTLRMLFLGMNYLPSKGSEYLVKEQLYFAKVDSVR